MKDSKGSSFAYAWFKFMSIGTMYFAQLCYIQIPAELDVCCLFDI